MRQPLDNLLIAVLCELVQDYTALQTNDTKGINVLRKYGDNPLIFRHQKPSKQLRNAWATKYAEWKKQQLAQVESDLWTWGHDLAIHFGISKEENFHKVVDGIKALGDILGRP